MQYSKNSLQATEGLEPRRLWQYFSEISQIPRESGNENGMRKYLLSFAKDHGIEALADRCGNVVMRMEATKGFEKVPSVALQGHMDMVCVKDEDVEHDFTKDPLKLQRNGDLLSAVGTSLGADNGIAIALILDLFSDPDAKHGPLEAIFTVSEETGMNGAFGLDATLIKSRKLLNLDSEEEGIFYIGCAGGVEINATLPVEWEQVPADYEQWDLVVSGLLGGHSGAEIGKQRANAISCVTRYLHTLNSESSVMLVHIDGGTKRNVIPSMCKASFLIPSQDHDKAISLAKEVLKDIKSEYSVSDPHISLSVSPSGRTVDSATSHAQSRKLINAVYITPHGVDRVSMTIKGLVETSSNLAVIKLHEDQFEITTSHRSSILSSRDYITKRTVAALETSGARCTLQNPYPSWTPDPKSPLAGFCSQAWQAYTGKPAEITAIHAGLECGIINSLVPGMDSLSLGPDLKGVHSTKETVSVSSTARVAAFLRHLLVTIQ